MLFGKQIGLLSHLSNDVVEELLGSLPYKTLNSESILYFQEDFGSSLYILLRGNVSLYQHTHDFRKAIFEVLGAGDCFGESALFKKPHQEFAQIVKGSAKIAICSRSAWQSWISEFPIIQNNLSEILSQRVFFLQKKLSSGTKLSDARLLEYIAYSIQKRGIQKGVQSEVRLETLKRERSYSFAAMEDSPAEALSDGPSRNKYVEFLYVKQH